MKPSELLSDESKWCKGAFARTADGRETMTSDPDAVRFCLYGAMARCGYDYMDIQRLRAHITDTPIPWNDAPERTFAEVKAALEACGL